MEHLTEGVDVAVFRALGQAVGQAGAGVRDRSGRGPEAPGRDGREPAWVRVAMLALQEADGEGFDYTVYRPIGYRRGAPSVVTLVVLGLVAIAVVFAF